jgi:hypothetical protein
MSVLPPKADLPMSAGLWVHALINKAPETPGEPDQILRKWPRKIQLGCSLRASARMMENKLMRAGRYGSVLWHDRSRGRLDRSEPYPGGWLTAE